MTKNREPFATRQVDHLRDDVAPLPLPNDIDAARLKRRILAVADPMTDTPRGTEYVALELRLRVEAARAKKLYKLGYRHFREAEDDLRKLVWHCRKIRQIAEKCDSNNLISDSLMSEIQASFESQLDPLAFSLESKRELHELCIDHPDVQLYDPTSTYAFPFQSLIDASVFVAEAGEAQLNSFKDEFAKYKIARRPESDILGKAVYDLHRTCGRDSVSYPGGNTGPCAQLYLELCKLAEIPEGAPREVLRKFQKSQ